MTSSNVPASPTAGADAAEGAGPLRTVLLLVNNLDVAGAQMVVVHLATHLSRFGWRPVVCAWKRGGPLEVPLRARGIEVVAPNRPREGFGRAQGIAAVVGLVRKQSATVIHAHMSDAIVLGVLAGRLSGRPCVATHHNEDLLDTTGAGRAVYRSIRGAILKVATSRAAANVAVSPPVADALLASSWTDPATVFVIENGVPAVPPEELARVMTARADREARGGRYTVLSVGRLTPTKDHRTLIRAWPLIASRVPGAELVVVGDGPERPHLVALAQELGVADSVRFTGTDPDPARWFIAADLFVSGSLVEGAPLVVLEAMGWAVPVVVSDHRVHRELCGQGNRGRLFPPGNAEALASGVVSARRDRPGTAARVAAASAHVRARHAVDSMVAHYSDLYSRVTGEWKLRVGA